MLYHWLTQYEESFQLFNLFNYITFRTGGALMTSMIIAFILGPRVINMLRSKQGKGQPIREDGPEGHIIKKAGTPTMGGNGRAVNLALGHYLDIALGRSDQPVPMDGDVGDSGLRAYRIL